MSDQQSRGATAEDREWLRARQPFLFLQDTRTITGKLLVNSERIDEASRKLRFFHQTTPATPNQWHIDETYQVRIVLPHGGAVLRAWDVGGTIRARMPALNLKRPIDAHLYDNNEVCLTVNGVLRYLAPEGSPLCRVFEDAIIPYFYYQSFWHKFGREPWPGLKHGAAGVLQSYYECRHLPVDLMDYLYDLHDFCARGIIYNHKIGPNDKCLCEKQIKVKKCRCLAVDGHKALRRKVTEMLLNRASTGITEARNHLYGLHKQMRGPKQKNP